MKKSTKYILLVLSFLFFFGAGFLSGKTLFEQKDISFYKARVYDGKLEVYSASEIYVLGDAEELRNNDPFYTAPKNADLKPEGYVEEAIRGRGEVIIEEPVYYNRSYGGGAQYESPSDSSSSEPASGDGQDIQWSDDML